jgi:ribosome recycling factor
MDDSLVGAALEDCREKMHKAVGHTQSEFSAVRTGRATPALVEKLRVDYYGSEVPLQQLAGFSVPEARTLVISPYDKSSMPAIEKAIQNSDLGMNPSNDGIVIRLSVPQLTEERRKDMVKLVGKMAEEARVHVRGIRREANDELKKRLKDGAIPQDDEKRAEQDIQKLTDRFIGQIDELLAKKTTDILEV